MIKIITIKKQFKLIFILLFEKKNTKFICKANNKKIIFIIIIIVIFDLKSIIIVAAFNLAN